MPIMKTNANTAVKIFLFILLIPMFFVYPGDLLSQEVKFQFNEYKDPSVFQKGQNDPHAFHVPYNSKQEAIKNKKEESGNFELLNGIWKFKWVEIPELVPARFWEPDFDTEEWDVIKVPSNWQMEGFGHAKFRNVALTFENDPPHIPEYYNPVGCYKRKFTIPKNWKGKEIMLRFEGIKSASYIWVNGNQVGYNQGGFEPAEFNITPFVKREENDLSIQVLRYCDGSYLENQDMWRLSGIFRDVKLYAQPKVYIHDHYVVTDLDRDYKNARLLLETDIVNSEMDSVFGLVEMDVIDSNNESILIDGSATEVFSAAPESRIKLNLTRMVIDPPKWSAEFPRLFTLLVMLKDKDGKTLEAFSQKIGFREVEYNNKLLTVNGIPVKLNGVNSHMHHPVHGQAVPFETLKRDLILMKQFNINCVRTCHYPPSPEYIDLADEMGIYIFDEVGDEAHSNTRLSQDRSWTEMYRDRSRKLVYRDRNHPSVIVWSAGNESGSGFNIREVIKTGKEIDPSRPAWMYGGNKFYIPYEDLVGPRYWIPLDYKNLAEGKILPEADKRSSFMDEYLAATGNGLGGMDEYWELIRKYPRLSGGAIWDWVSPGIYTPRWILPDRSPKQIHGQIMGRPVFTEGKNGRGLEFSGHDDWVEFYRDPNIDINGDQLSVSFWVKSFPIPQPNTFLSKGSSQYGIRMNTPESIEFYIHSGKRISATAKVDTSWYGQWHHVAGIYNGKELKLYVDKHLKARKTFSGNISSSPFPLCVGREADTHDQGEMSGRLSKMVMDDVKIFNTAVPINRILDDTLNAVLNIDFETDSQDGKFFAVGLGGRTYGLIWPDRQIQPELYQVKKSGQPVKTEAVDIEKGIVRFTNYHHFKNLDQLEGVWVLTVEGDTVQRGFFSTELPPLQSKTDTIPFRMPEIEENSECILTISFLLQEDTNWALAGHEIAWEQFVIPALIYPGGNATSAPPIKVKEDVSSLHISGNNFSYSFSKENGKLISMNIIGKEILHKGPSFNVWRAPTANDTDPWGSYMFMSKKTTPGFGRSIDNQLRTLGMRDLVSQLYEFKVLGKSDSKVILQIRAYSNSSLPAGSDNTRRRNNSAFERNEKWIISADGAIELEVEIIPHGAMPDMLQKTGYQFELAKAFNRAEWYGRGPFETYPDRKTGAKKGTYSQTAEEMFTPYIIPQEYGNRTDVRWLKITDEEGTGVLIKSSDLLNFSLHNVSTDNLSRAVYSYQLQESPATILNVDFEVSGVGGTAIRQLKKYQVTPGIRNYNLSIKPLYLPDN